MNPIFEKLVPALVIAGLASIPVYIHHNSMIKILDEQIRDEKIFYNKINEKISKIAK